MISNDNFDAIAALDLDAIKVKLMHKESGEGWSLAQANAVEVEYRRFLILMKKYPAEQTAPLFDVDIFWHYHILDTMKYALDCQAVFGYFLHHFPYIGLRGEADEAAHERVGERMKQLYEETFGESYLRPAVAPDRTAQTAFSSSPAQIGDAMAKIAFSSAPASRTAFSSAPAARSAFSSAPARQQHAVSAFSSAPAAQDSAGDGFYADRPGLTR